MRDHRYALITCPRCRKSFLIVTRWTKKVRCRYCGFKVEVDLARRILFRDREEARKHMGA